MKKKETAASFGVIGLGRFGLALVECLSKAEKAVIAVDRAETRVKDARRFTDFALVVESYDQEALEEIGIQNCDTVVICISDRIDTSILITMTVLNMKVPHVVTKAASLMHGEVLKRLGAQVVFPERDMAVRLGKGLVYHSFLDSVALEGDVEIRKIQITDSLKGTSIEEADIRQKYGLNIIALEHDHRTDVDFPSSYRFKEGDVICVVGQTKNVERFENDLA